MSGFHPLSAEDAAIERLAGRAKVKIGPGKATGFGYPQSKPIFCLPGGPPSNQIAFLQLALPGLLLLGGNKDYSLPSLNAVLGETVRGQMDWTQFIFGRLSRGDGEPFFIL